jgi:hypothetical protein
VKTWLRFRPAPVGYLLAGAAMGIAVLHPVVEAVYWFASPDRPLTGSGSLWRSIAGRLLHAFTPDMLPMTGLFALLGAAIGLGFGLYAANLDRLRGTGAWRGDDFAAILSAGQGERIEFKSHARWDPRLGRINRALEEALARSIAGFLNHEGGTLLIGVTDAGNVAGLQADYQTLKRRDRDGFQQFLMGLVQSKLGGHICAQVHVEFHEVRDMDVCQVMIERSAAPVYYQDGSVARYFVRTGNGTRELDVREAIVHVARRRTEAGPPNPGSG